MKYIVTKSKTVEHAGKDLGKAVERHGLGVLQIHNLQETKVSRSLKSAIPLQAKKVLEDDMDLNMALP